jgi:hypothetical protein
LPCHQNFQPFNVIKSRKRTRFVMHSDAAEHTGAFKSAQIWLAVWHGRIPVRQANSEFVVTERLTTQA